MTQSMYVESLSMTVMLRYIHGACAAVLVCDLDTEQCIAEHLEVERVSAGDQALALSWNRASICAVISINHRKTALEVARSI